MNPDQKSDDRRVTYFASTHTRGKREIFGIRAIDRGKHMYVIGKTGMGKSTMLENLAIQDIQNGEGLAFIDPHGSTAQKLLDFVPYERIKDVVYFAPFDTDFPMGFNVMEDVGYDKRHLVVSGLMGAFKRIWVDAWSARMEYFLQNTLLALLEYPDSTLLDVNRMLVNKEFRKAVVEKVQDPIVKAWWQEEFAAFTDKYTAEATPAIQNKIGQFISNPLIRNIIGQSRSSFDIRKLMDEKKILIVDLSKGRMGETNAQLLGSMLTVKIYLAAMSRADEPASRMARLPRFYFFVDEFQSMMNEAFAAILSEARKYKLALTLANQYVEQMEENVRNAVFGNVGTMITFRVGPFDAETLKTIYEPTFHPEDLVNLGIGEIYLTLMIDGVGTPPFSAQTIPPIEAPAISYRDDVINNSRAQFGRPRAEVEAFITQRSTEFAMPVVEKKPRYDMRGNIIPNSSGQRPSGGPGNGAPRGGNGNGSNGFAPRSNGGYNGAPPQRSPLDLVKEQRAAMPPAAPHPPAPVRPQAEARPMHEAPARGPRPDARPIPRPRLADPFAARAEQQPEPPERNALRDAISAARIPASAPQAPAPVAEQRSPADMLRDKGPREEGARPRAPLPPHVQPVMPSQRQAERPRQDAPRSVPPTPPERDNGEVSAEVLARVLKDDAQ
ncbi:hypothetical protein FJY94_05420 [Candidatus Kaiserbacteria bacterium]|nr:hypothetical protein [Candidatus Kaiserbacteria bacterium]